MRFPIRRTGWIPVTLTASLALLVSGVPAADARPEQAPAPAAITETAAAQAKRPPNIVLVLTDDLEPSLLRFMPRVRAMQARGANFTNYTVSDSLCCPSRASILTGQYPHTSGIYTNTEPDGGYGKFKRLGLEQQTFAVSMQRAGYQTSFMGKYMNGYDPLAGNGQVGSNVPPGWTDWHVGGNGYRNFNYTLNENGREVRYGKKRADYLTDVLARKSGRFIRSSAAAGQPFALEVSTFSPHGPFTPAPRDAKAYPGLKAPRGPAFNEANLRDKPAWLRGRPKLTKAQIAQIDKNYRKRAQSVRSIDALIGTIRRTLKATGQLDNTYIVFTSDNGFHMGEHRLPTGKQTAFATDIEVPLVVNGPGVGHRSIGQLAQNVDLAPTFADLGGAATLRTADGRSLAPLLRGRTPANWRQAALVEHRGPNIDPGDPDRPGPRGANPPTYNALTTRSITYVEYVDGSREYYNNRTDPHQLKNAYSSLSRTRRAALKHTLADLVSCHGTADCQVR